jgi:hypothetical protein
MNRAYLGEQRIPNPEKKGEPRVIPNSHKPLVTEAEWQAANAVRNPAPARRGLSERTQLKGIVRCGSCERTMHVLSYGKTREKITYACTNCGKTTGASSTAAASQRPGTEGWLGERVDEGRPCKRIPRMSFGRGEASGSVREGRRVRRGCSWR